jgi:hypothetical protein
MKQENCCTPIGQIKRYVDCKGCDRKPKQETLVEVFNKIVDSSDYIMFDYASFEEGAKWQQERSYSEEEVLELLLTSKIEKHEDIKEWFEKFKKP